MRHGDQVPPGQMPGPREDWMEIQRAWHRLEDQRRGIVARQKALLAEEARLDARVEVPRGGPNG